MEEKTGSEGYALIITGGDCDTEAAGRIIPEDPGIVIAADSGLETALRLGIEPDVALGDFDSYTGEIPEKCRVRVIPREKDVTDTMYAAMTAVSMGFGSILVIGGTGGRLDHTVANLQMLVKLSSDGIRAVMTDGRNTVRALRDETFVLRPYRGYFSLFSFEGCELTLEGCKYPLDGYRLGCSDSLAVSNETLGRDTVITVKGQALLMTYETTE